MLAIHLSSPTDILVAAARRAKDRRLLHNLTQLGLATRAGVSLGTLKLFERTGKASFETVVRIAFALEAEHQFDGLFPPVEITRIDDVIEKVPRKRGRRR